MEMYGSTIAPTHLKERNFAEAAAPHIAEFVGTYLLVFAIAVCGILAERSYGPTAIGSILTVLVYIFQPISGAYLNPAASVAAGLVGQIPWKTVMAYVVLQITAGFIAGLACYEVFHLPMGVAPVAPFEFGDAAFLEVLYTAMLCFVILSVTASRRDDLRFLSQITSGFTSKSSSYCCCCCRCPRCCCCCCSFLLLLLLFLLLLVLVGRCQHRRYCSC